MKIFVDKVRTERGLSVRELHRMSGVALSHLHNIENGNKIPTLTVICKLAKALDIAPSELFSCDD